jgi:hypothetical protein
MYFGNIISKTPINLEGFKNYSSEDLIENDLPTIVIGWDLVKEMYGDKVSILHKTINLKTYWTFSSKERKADYEVDLESFKELCYNSFGDNVPYVYLDILYGKKNVNKKIIKKILTLKNPYIFVSDNNMVYIYGDNIIFGIDFNILDYFYGKKEKVLRVIKNLNSAILIDSKIFNKYRDFLYKIKNKNRLIPYIIKNGND